tara:strand:+ start:190470 stop:191387 length:918 start_codon:yes stop_codon:yes gene_type:complete
MPHLSGHNLAPWRAKPTVLLSVALSFLLAVPAFTISAISPESKREAQDQIRLLSGILEEMPERMRLESIDMFESERDYYTRAPSTDLSIIDYVYRSPDGAEFLEEMELLKSKVDPEASYHRSLMIHTSFDVPGKQLYQVLLRHPVPLEGELIRLSLWVHGQDQKHSLSALFLDPRGKEVEVPLGALAFKGWKRITVNLPAGQFRRGRDMRIRPGGKFRGFLIRSHPQEEAGPVSIMVDNVLVLKDMRKLMYPGAEIQDTWGKGSGWVPASLFERKVISPRQILKHSGFSILNVGSGWLINAPAYT